MFGRKCVLILVVMEDALVLIIKAPILVKRYGVLILVVMEDALVHQEIRIVELSSSLNPCCNGRCTRTYPPAVNNNRADSCLNPCCNGRCTRTLKKPLTRALQASS